MKHTGDLLLPIMANDLWLPAALMYAIPVTRALSTIAFNLRLTYRPILLTYKSCLDLRHKKEGTRPVVYLRPFHVVLSSKQIDGMRNSDISAIAFSEDKTRTFLPASPLKSHF